MKKPVVIEKFSDNGELSHYELVNPETGEVLWVEEHKYDYEEIVKKIISEELEIKIERITATSTFHEFGADRLNLVQIISNIEDVFHTVFVNSEIDRIKTVGDIFNHLEKVC
jgi:acyl carrier protein